MSRPTNGAHAFVALVLISLIRGMATANTGAPVPDPSSAGIAAKLYRLDCGHSTASDESVWTPGENAGRSVDFSSTCWLVKHDSQWLLWDTGVPESALNDPRGWSTLPRLIVYHLDKSLTDQLTAIGLKRSDIDRIAISHTHGDHIGNLALFPDATVMMQRAEYSWIHSADGLNMNVNALMALARTLMGSPKRLQLLDGDTDIFGDGSVVLLSTPGHTPGHQSLLVHLRNSGFIILSGDVAHSKRNLEKNIVPTLNTDAAESVRSMQRVNQLIARYRATLFINHDKFQNDCLRAIPLFYD